MKSLPLVLSALVVLAVWLNVSPSVSLEPPEPTERAIPVQVSSLTASTGYTTERLYTGEVVAGRTTRTGFLRAGEVVEILVNEGDRVERGQLLARLDTRSLEANRRLLLARRASAAARLREAQAGPRPERKLASTARQTALLRELELAQQKQARRSELYAQGAVAREQLDDYSTRVRTLELQLEEARQQTLELDNGTRIEQLDALRAQVAEVDAQLQQVRVDFQDSELRAPFSGLLSQRLLDEGAIVAAGTPLLELYEDQTLEAIIPLPLDAVAPDQSTLEVAGSQVPARLLGWRPLADTRSATRSARYLVRGAQITPGLTASLRLSRQIDEPGFWVPSEALVSAGKGLWDCYTVTEESRLRRQQVEVLTTQGDQVLVRGTLREGQTLVVKDTESLVAGQLVVPLSPARKG